MNTTRAAAVATSDERAMAYLVAHQAGRLLPGGDDHAGGYALGAVGPLDWLRMAQTVIGTTLVAAGTSALNHYIERDSDARMRRTASRPLPSGVLAPAEALLFGVALVAAGIIESSPDHERCWRPSLAPRAPSVTVSWACTRRSKRAPPAPRWSAHFPAPCRR